MEQVMQSFAVMIQGMLGIFIVMGAISLVIAGLNKIFR